ncbi:MAG TPA: hypothetical protein VMS64_30135 [Candidatus Methylomirabilis sp.]|nr:hypothetical protein [Candidatus Methylomirabilis sp.]
MKPRAVLILALALGLVAAPHVGEAQQAGKVYRIGILGLGQMTSDMTGPQPKSPYVKALLDGLRELGYGYGKQFVTEPRGAEGKYDRFPSLVDELLRIHVDLIVAEQLQVVPSQESESAAAERIAYGVLVASLEEGLVTTLQHAMDVLRRFSTPAGALGEQWLSEQGGSSSVMDPADLVDDDDQAGALGSCANTWRSTSHT